MGEAGGALWSLAAVLAVLAATAARLAFLRASAGAAVDHYYWVLAARAYRRRQGLPVRLAGKYLLEDERQAYPPGFGLFLAALPETWVAGRRSAIITLAIDAATLALLLLAGAALDVGRQGLVAIILVYGLAPVLVAYNTQLTSRGFGNLLLVVSLLAQAGAAASTGAATVALAALGASALAGVIATHKMTTQCFAFLWPFWPFALDRLGPNGAWIGAVTPFAAFAVVTLATGLRFQALQWRAHWDIVTFWARNWRFLGAHQFRQSPIYGDPSSGSATAFHGKGLAGAFRHATLVAAYLPAALPLPATLFFVQPPAFVLAWCGAAFLAAFLTLYVPPLKCLGTGHYYVFNAVAPAALWWGVAFSDSATEPVVTGLFAVGLLLTALSLAAGLRRRARRPGGADQDAAAVVARLARHAPTRVAAFPASFAERIALETDHAVFWGGHGLGFRTLEPYWPVMRAKLGDALRRWGVTHAVLDLQWWPEGETVFAAETGDPDPERIGRFALYRIAP